MPGVAPLPGPPFPLRGFGRGGPLPLGMFSPLPGPRPPPPGIDVRHWNQGVVFGFISAGLDLINAFGFSTDAFQNEPLNDNWMQ